MSNNNTNSKPNNKPQSKPTAATSTSTPDSTFHNSGIDIAANLGLNFDHDTQAIVNLLSATDLPTNEEPIDNRDIQDILKTLNDFPATSAPFDINELSSFLDLNSPSSMSTPINYTEPNIQELLGTTTSSPTTFTPPPAPPRLLPKSKTMDIIPKATSNTPIRPMPVTNPPLNLSSAVPIRAKLPNIKQASTSTPPVLPRVNSLQTIIPTSQYRPQAIRPSIVQSPVGRPSTTTKGVRQLPKKSTKAPKAEFEKIKAKLSKRENDMLELLIEQCKSKKISPEVFRQQVQALLGSNYSVDNQNIIKESTSSTLEQQSQQLRMRPQPPPPRLSSFQTPPINTPKQPQTVHFASNVTTYSPSEPRIQPTPKPKAETISNIKPAPTPTPAAVPQSATNNTFQAPKNAPSANPTDDKVDFDALTDVMNSVGVDLREESENIMKENDLLAHQNGLDHPQEDHTRSQSFANTPLLAHKMLLIAKNQGLNNVDIDAVNYMALACQHRLRTLISSMIHASKHRTRSNQFPEPPMTRNNTPLFKIVISQDPKKQLSAIERADREEESIFRNFLKEKEEEGGDGAKTKKNKARKDGTSIGAAARNINEEQRRKTANATALLSAGGVQKSWMLSTSTELITPPAPPPSQPSSRPSEPTPSSNTTPPPKPKKPKTKTGQFLKDSSDISGKGRSYLGSQPLLGRLGSLSSHLDRVVTLSDAIFALENDHVAKFAQKEQRVLLKAYTRQWN